VLATRSHDSAPRVWRFATLPEHASSFEAHEAPTLNGREQHERPSVVDPLVLIVDDDEDARAIYCVALGLMGYPTLDCRDGDQALKAVRERRPDVVLTDIAMPGVDGVEVTRRIKGDESLGSTYVIVMTAFGDAKYADAMRCGCDAFLCKPFNPLVLEDLLSAHFSSDEIVKVCGCGRSYTRSQWRALAFRGTMEGAELRNCACGSSLALCRRPLTGA
jgi:CheY-like chemotaxis protein